MKVHLRNQEENITMNNSDITDKKSTLWYSLLTSILLWGFYLIGLELLDSSFLAIAEVIVGLIVSHSIISSIVLGGAYYFITIYIHNEYSSANILKFILLSVAFATIIGIALLMILDGDNRFEIIFVYPRIVIALISITIFMIIRLSMKVSEEQ